MIKKMFMNKNGYIRSGFKILLFIELITVFARTGLGDMVRSILPYDIDTVLIILIISFMMLHYVDRKPLKSLGVFLEKKWGSHFSIGFLIAAVFNIVLFVLLWMFGLVSWEFNQTFSLSAFAGSVLLLIFVSTFQELIFRGYLFQRLSEGIGKYATVIITSIAFALYHSNSNFLGWINLAFAGAIFAVSFIRSRMLWFAIGMHVGWNIFEGCICSLPVSGGGGLMSIFETQVRDNVLLTGGEFGPEASLLLTPILILILIWSLKTEMLETPILEYQGKNIKPVLAYLVGGLSIIGPVLYFALHIPSTADMPNGKSLNLPITIYEQTNDNNDQNKIDKIKIYNLISDSNNDIEITASIDTQKYDQIDFKITFVSHALVKRQQKTRNYYFKNLKPVNRIRIPVPFGKLRKNTVLKFNITLTSQQNNKRLNVMDKEFKLIRYIDI